MHSLTEPDGCLDWRRVILTSPAAKLHVFLPSEHQISDVDLALRNLKNTYAMHDYLFITLTMTPAEIRECTNNNKRLVDYLKVKLKSFGFIGVFVVEQTRKGFPHLHGIVPITSLLPPSSLQQLKKEWIAHLNVKLISNYKSYIRYSTYMQKEFISPSILEWINQI